MDATLILIDSDAELLRARALVDQLWNSSDPTDVARLGAQARLIAAYEEMKWPRRPPSVADLIRHLMDQLSSRCSAHQAASVKCCAAKRSSAWRWCSVCAPVSVCRPICSFLLRRSRRPGVPPSERRPEPGASPRWNWASIIRCLAAASVTGIVDYH
jgi:hypothetical protein